MSEQGQSSVHPHFVSTTSSNRHGRLKKEIESVIGTRADMQLDAGLDEKIMLVSRDDSSCLVVSYREIKTCVEAAYS